MSKETKQCPFNSFNPCIGENCALYLKDVKAIANNGKLQVEIAFPELLSKCALTFTGVSACYTMAEKMAHPIFHDNQLQG